MNKKQMILNVWYKNIANTQLRPQRYFFTLICLAIFSFASAQSRDSIPELSIIARPLPDKIMLKWAATSPALWRKMIENGVYLSRTTLVRNQVAVDQKETVFFNHKQPIKPAPPEYWMSVIEENDNAAIMAQALFGESFEVTSENQNEITTLINKIHEEEQRYVYSLMVADRDFEVAGKAGMAFVDTTVKANEMYRYEIILASPPGSAFSDTASVFTGSCDYIELPQITDVASDFQDGYVILSWDDRLFDRTYSSYLVERSQDKIHFTKINESPVVNFNSSEGGKLSAVNFTDTITNGSEYYYRIKGISFFGEIGPASEIISGRGQQELKAIPHFTSYEFMDSSVKLSWEYPKDAIPLTEKLEISRSISEEGEYVLLKGEIPPYGTETIIDKLLPSNYFKITVVGKNGKRKTSMPFFVQQIDSIPPSPPTGLSAEIDTMGIVSIKWKANTESDILGYKVLRNNSLSEEFSLLNSSAITVNNYTDTVQIETVNEMIYYRVVAIDQRNNHSGFSSVLKVKKPDVIPPTPPLFTDFKVTAESVFLQWVNSSSVDVNAHRLMRQNTTKDETSLPWDTIYRWNGSSDHFYDEDIEAGQEYRYTMIAIDDAGLFSALSIPVVVKIPSGINKSVLTNFKVIPDSQRKNIRLSWRSIPEEIRVIKLYKAEKEASLTLYKEFDGEVVDFVDDKVTLGSSYKYVIRAIDRNNNLSETLEKTVKF